MKRTLVVLLLAMSLAILAGCGGSKAPAAATPALERQAPAAQAGDASPTEAADTTQATQTGSDQTASSNTGGQGDENTSLNLSAEEAALKNLKSYKTTWSFQWTGQEDGKDHTIEWLSAEAYTADPPATHTKFESSDSAQPAQGGTMEFYQIGSKSYMVSQQDGKPQCTAFTSEDNKPEGSFLNRGAFGSISSGRLVGTETVNGVRAKHYRYDEKSTGVNLFDKLNGDVWVAEDGGYVVKDSAQWEGRLFGMLSGSNPNAVGKGSWTQEVTDINQPFQITPPDGCENAAEGLPTMADATEQSSFGAMTTYKSASKLADVAKFYQTEMPKAGWQEAGDAQVTDGFASLTFTKDGKKANVILTTEESKVNVMITVE